MKDGLKTTSLLSVGSTILLLTATGLAAAAEMSARDILAASGVKGGLVVHIGCDDGRSIADLHGGPSYVVHALDTNSEKVATAREIVQSLGLTGQVTIDRFDGQTLPYVDNLVSLIVVDTRCAMRDAGNGIRDPGSEVRDVGSEILRVLAPRGVAIVREKGNEAWLSRIAHPISRFGAGFAMFAKPGSPRRSTTGPTSCTVRMVMLCRTIPLWAHPIISSGSALPRMRKAIRT